MNVNALITFITAHKRSCVKVMFSQVFVCPRGGGGFCPGGSLSEGSLSRGRGSLSGGSLSRGVSVRETPHTETSGRYASYWHAFLFFKLNQRALLPAAQNLCFLYSDFPSPETFSLISVTHCMLNRAFCMSLLQHCLYLDKHTW